MLTDQTQNAQAKHGTKHVFICLKFQLLLAACTLIEICFLAVGEFPNAVDHTAFFTKSEKGEMFW